MYERKYNIYKSRNFIYALNLNGVVLHNTIYKSRNFIYALNLTGCGRLHFLLSTKVEISYMH